MVIETFDECFNYHDRVKVSTFNGANFILKVKPHGMAHHKVVTVPQKQSSRDEGDKPWSPNNSDSQATH